MWKNYLTIAYRTLKRRPGYTTINVFGLAVGLACCLLIALYVRKELSYDDFHKNADRLVIVGMERSFAGNMNSFLITPYPLAGALERNLPGVKKAIVMLLSKDFLKLVLVAFIIAVPVAYYAMQRWLQDFAYRIELGPWIFVGAGALALVIALFTVSYQPSRPRWPIRWRRCGTSEFGSSSVVRCLSFLPRYLGEHHY